MPTRSNFCCMEKNKKLNLQQPTNHNYDTNIDDKKQVRDPGIMMSNTATFTVHIIKLKRPKTRWDGCWECFSRGSALPR